MYFGIVKIHFEHYCMNKRKEHRFFGSFVIIHSIYLQKCHEDKQLEQKVGLLSRAHYMAYSEIICRRIDHICCRVLVHIFFLEGGPGGGFLRRPPNKGWPGGQCGGLLVKIKASCVCCTENWDMNKKEVESMITWAKKLLFLRVGSWGSNPSQTIFCYFCTICVFIIILVRRPIEILHIFCSF